MYACLVLSGTIIDDVYDGVTQIPQITVQDRRRQLTNLFLKFDVFFYMSASLRPR